MRTIRRLWTDCFCVFLSVVDRPFCSSSPSSSDVIIWTIIWSKIQCSLIPCPSFSSISALFRSNTLTLSWCKAHGLGGKTKHLPQNNHGQRGQWSKKHEINHCNTSDLLISIFPKMSSLGRKLGENHRMVLPHSDRKLLAVEPDGIMDGVVVKLPSCATTHRCLTGRAWRRGLLARNKKNKNCRLELKCKVLSAVYQ